MGVIVILKSTGEIEVHQVCNDLQKQLDELIDDGSIFMVATTGYKIEHNQFIVNIKECNENYTFT